MLFPASFLCGYLGRKYAFMIGGALGMIGGVLFYFGISGQSLGLVCVGTGVIGLQRSFVEYYRFAVVELVSDGAKAFAMSLVISGGVFASFIGPNLARYSRQVDGDILPNFLQADFSATALIVVLMCFAQFALFLLIYRHKKEVHAHPAKIADNNASQKTSAQQQSKQQKGRALSQAMGLNLLGDYRHYIIMAIIIISAGSAIMTLMMNAAPIAMQHEFALSFDQAAKAVQWHVFAMYFPSFFTGYLLKKWNALPIALAGLALLIICAFFSIWASAHTAFVLSLILLGVGWNFCYFSGSYLLVQVTPAHKKSLIQGVNDTVVYAFNVIGSLLAGVAIGIWGWSNLSIISLCIVIGLLVITLLRKLYLQPDKTAEV